MKTRIEKSEFPKSPGEKIKAILSLTKYLRIRSEENACPALFTQSYLSQIAIRLTSMVALEIDFPIPFNLKFKGF